MSAIDFRQVPGRIRTPKAVKKGRAKVVCPECAYHFSATRQSLSPTSIAGAERNARSTAAKHDRRTGHHAADADVWTGFRVSCAACGFGSEIWSRSEDQAWLLYELHECHDPMVMVRQAVLRAVRECRR